LAWLVVTGGAGVDRQLVPPMVSFKSSVPLENLPLLARPAAKPPNVTPVAKKLRTSAANNTPIIRDERFVSFTFLHLAAKRYDWMAACG
jgi:hypothetical protein